MTSSLRTLAAATIPFVPTTESSFQGLASLKIIEQFRFYQCNLHPSNTYACKKISDPSEKLPSDPLGISQIVSVPVYFPETFDKQYIKNSLSPTVKIVPSK